MIKISDLLTGKDSQEKAHIKSERIAALPLQGKFKDKGVEVNIISINEIDGGIEVFAQAWKDGKQLGFGADGSVDIERFRIYNPPILVDDPNGDIVRTSIDTDTQEIRTRKLREDPRQAFYEALLHIIQLVGKDGENIVAGKVGNTTSTFYSTAGGDGTLYSLSAAKTWAASRSGTNVSVDSLSATNSSVYLATYSTPDFEMRRFYTPVDTSAIPSGDAVSSAIMSLYQQSTSAPDELSSGVGLLQSNQASGTTLVVGDWAPFSFTEIATRKTMASLNALQYWDWTITDLTVIAKGSGFTKLVFATGHDIDNTEPALSKQSSRHFHFADEAGTSKDPKLVVEHAVASSRSRLLLLGVS